MIGGLFPDNKFNITEKISNFYLPNKEEFEKSIGLDFSNRLSANRVCNNEVVILAQFCELVGPMPLIVVPEDTEIGQRTVDMIVLKAMSADYQSCSEGDTLIPGYTDILDSDCIVPFFAHYFTLLDVYGRGYVRPCCIIVCCSDRLRATYLFDYGTDLIRRVLAPFASNNLTHFCHEVRCNLVFITDLLESSDNGSVVTTDINIDELRIIKDDYVSLVESVSISEEKGNDDSRMDTASEQLFFKSIQGNCMRRCLRSIYTIMMCLETDMITVMRSLAENLKKILTPRMFSLHEPSDIDLAETVTSESDIISLLSKYNLRYFLSAVTCDRIVHVISKFSSICCCRKSTDGHGRLSNTSDLDTTYIFPSLIAVQGSQCQYVSNICQQLTIPIVTKLIGCILQQCHLAIIVDNKHYYHLMRLLALFQPKADKQHYVAPRSNWPSIDELNEFPVTQINNQTRSPAMPNHLKRFVAVYDATINKYMCGPEYNKGHLVTFLEMFKALNYNQCHLDSIVNILVLSYFDLIYQWIAMLVKRKDRRSVSKYIIDTGATAEDSVISERLALFVLQKLVICHQSELAAGPNLFLTCPSLFNSQCIKFSAKDK